MQVQKKKLLGVGLAVWAWQFGVWAADVPDFSREILPILSENCFHCHGQDAKARKGDLRLDTEAEAKKMIDGARPVVAGSSAQSEIMRRMLSKDPDEQMPPPKSNRRVSPDEVARIGRWIDGGAKWGEHWAFVPVGKNNQGHSIDSLVKAKLQARNWQHSPEASPEMLIRRLSLDLTGLPPRPDEVAQFTADSASPTAYESLVDRLLASPRFGERWVWEWLDASRYADSNGYQGDNDRTAWPWRDWVIRALNDNMPYDQFTLWQLAGDLLPQATKEQKLATAFVRNHMINGEGGRIAEENRIEYLFDQAETVGTVWLGLTLQCTRCHDHKFDPLTMDDYYGMVAFFNSTPVDGQGRGGQTPPVLDMSTEQETERVRLATTNVEEWARKVEAFELKKFPRPAGKGLEESDAIKLPGNLPSYIGKTPPAKRGIDPLLEAVNYFKGDGRDPEYAKLLGDLLKAVRERTSAASSVTKVMVMEERKEGPRDTLILKVGAYDAPTDRKVLPHTPTAMIPMPKDAPRNRLGLARWLVARENPLTARVTVNRYWQSLFGIGLVKTAEDFGVQGERPLHMDLLDFLAADFMDHGWDVKRLIKMIVMSQTYRQSSRLPPGAAGKALLEADPDNRYFARAPRFRLPSFMLRDQALALSGLLVEKQGGPSVRPYQPEGIWEEASFGKIAYRQGTGSDLYRRTLYTFWRRIVGPTMIFDNAARQTCVVKASRTNTPLHALVTLNETTFVESARVLAQSVLQNKTLPDDAARLADLWLRATARRATEAEVQTLATTLAELRSSYAATPAEAARLLAVGASPRAPFLPAPEHAAWASLCLLVLNLDEVLSKQ